MSMITVKSPNGKTIYTDACPVLRQIIEDDGIPWFEALKGPENVSKKAFDEIDNLVSLSLWGKLTSQKEKHISNEVCFSILYLLLIYEC